MTVPAHFYGHMPRHQNEPELSCFLDGKKEINGVIKNFLSKKFFS